MTKVFLVKTDFNKAERQIRDIFQGVELTPSDLELIKGLIEEHIKILRNKPIDEFDTIYINDSKTLLKKLSEVSK